MAHFHTKNKNGRPYLYVREIARVNGKPKVISQTYIGSPEKVRALIKGDDNKDGSLRRLKVEEFGSLWLALKADNGIDLVSIVDEIIPPDPRESGPTLGEYFLYAVLNRMIEPKSKRAIPEWYQSTAIQQLRPVDIDSLNSQRYWAKWNKIDQETLEKIANVFFEKAWQNEESNGDCLLFDTTNFYTYMASKTRSELAARGKNKAGKHHLRQIGMALLVGRDNKLPVFYREYPGNQHDSKVFGSIMSEMLTKVAAISKTKQRITLVFDKGMNAEDNFDIIDDSPLMHFVTTYSPWYAREMATVSAAKFASVNIPRNRRLEMTNNADDAITAYRTSGEFWGKTRTVVVTNSPATARKQEYVFEAKLEAIRTELLSMRKKTNEGCPQWRDEDEIRERYLALCSRMHMASEYFELEFSKTDGTLSMSFRKNAYRTELRKKMFGRNIIITDNTDWKTEDIVQASLDRYMVEEKFRQANQASQVAALPMRHWTDAKMRCHLFCCVVAMTYLRKIEMHMEKAGLKITAAGIMEKMKKLHSVLTINKTGRPVRCLETPDKTQKKTLEAYGWEINKAGVLQKRPS